MGLSVRQIMVEVLETNKNESRTQLKVGVGSITLHLMRVYLLD